MGAKMTYQLVFQLPGRTSADYDRMLRWEEEMIKGLGDFGEVDGHDMGAGEMNIFVLTDQPQAAFDRIKVLIGAEEFMRELKVAYREIGKSQFTIVHPPGLTRFTIA